MTYVFILQLLNIGLVILAIDLRFDEVFNDVDVKELLSTLSITETNFKRALDMFTKVVCSLSISCLVTVIATIVITIKRKVVLLFFVSLC